MSFFINTHVLPSRKKVTLVVLLMATVSACVARNSSEETPAQSEKTFYQSQESIQSIFRVDATTCDANANKNATAIAISNELLVTVAHVFDETNDFAIHDAQGKKLETTLAHLDRERDIAILRSAMPLEKSFIRSDPQKGDNIWFATYADAEQPMIKTAQLLELTTISIDQEQEKEAIQISAQVEAGDSGGVLLNEKGEAIGMIFATSTSDPHGWALSNTELSTALQNYSSTATVPLPSCSDTSASSQAMYKHFSKDTPMEIAFRYTTPHE